jgi:NADP-dependent 3-hydroxy acid dehydrogenase YdfG
METNIRRIAVITGASAGIGRATARHFGARGWRVALLARGVDGLEGARREIEQAGGEALVIPTDVASHEAVDSAAGRVEREWGPIDVWVNDAMATIFCEFGAISPEDYRRATEVTYLGTVWGTRAVQVGSALAYRSIPLQAPYCGAKAAIRGFTDAVRSELIHHRSRVHLTMVQLSAFNTPQFSWGRTCMSRRPQPLPPIFQPEVAARAIYFAATHRRREVWVGFPALKAIIATRLMPGLLDRILATKAYKGQHTDEPLPAVRPDNLYAPVPGDHGAHGRFGARSKRASAQTWLTMHRAGALGACALALGAALLARFAPRAISRIR